MQMPRSEKTLSREALVEKCLFAFLRAGTLDLSLDRLARAVGISKRMLIHYFGGRDAIEEMAMALLEDRLRARFQASVFPAGTSPQAVVMALWEQTTSPQSRGVLQLAMDLTRRSWSGSARARRFFEGQQRLWTEMFREFIPDPATVETLLQLFQGATLVYLVTGDQERGRRALERLMAVETTSIRVA